MAGHFWRYGDPVVVVAVVVGRDGVDDGVKEGLLLGGG